MTLNVVQKCKEFYMDIQKISNAYLRINKEPNLNNPNHKLLYIWFPWGHCLLKSSPQISDEKYDSLPVQH